MEQPFSRLTHQDNGIDYRRGFTNRGDGLSLEKQWHFEERCENYPSRNFAVQKEKPAQDDICVRCQSVSRGQL